MSTLAEILKRRARLLSEAEAQRRAISESIAGCRPVLHVVDRGVALASWLRAKPFLVVAAVAAMAMLGPRLALGWTTRLLSMWRVGHLFFDVVRLAARGRGVNRPGS